MIVLGIDTSGPTGGVALVSEDGVIAECILDVRRTYSEHLMTALDFMLRESSIGLADIDGVCVSRGPGSYTGLRMGVTVGKTLCYCLGIPLAGVSTLRAVAQAVAGLGVTAVPLIDARRSRVYASAIAFEYGESVGTEVIPEALIEVSELKGLVASLPGRLCFLGPGAARHGEELRSCAPERSCVFPADQSICRPSHVARLGAQKLSSGESEDLFEFEPVYFRASEAEVRWSESHRT
jgi:tRNA threonylcarbamoyladenosine biosynthesis protein TsaB